MLNTYRIKYIQEKKECEKVFKAEKNSSLKDFTFVEGAIYAINTIIREQKALIKELDNLSYIIWWKGFSQGIVCTLIILLILHLIF
jgi:hypothetical protein